MKRFVWRWPWQGVEPEPVRPPKVGGTRASDTVLQIDFTKPHDFHFHQGYNRGTTVVFQRCILVGFTTPMGENADESNFREYSHTRWLVLRNESGRHVYVPRDGLSYIQESEPATREGSVDGQE